MALNVVRVPVPLPPDMLEAGTNVARVWFPDLQPRRAREMVREIIEAVATVDPERTVPVRLPGLTKKQARAFFAIHDMSMRDGAFPSMRALAKELDVKVPTAWHFRKELQEAGYLRVKKRTGRITWLKPLD